MSFEASGGVYWIGYCGPLSDYPVDDGQELSEFYAKTLNSVPKSVLDRTLYRFTFDVDRSLKSMESLLTVKYRLRSSEVARTVYLN